MSLPISNIRSLSIWLVIMLAIVLFVALFLPEWSPEEDWLRMLMYLILLSLLYRFRDVLFDTADKLSGREKKNELPDTITSSL